MSTRPSFGRSSWLTVPVLLMLGGALSGCDLADPYQREGMWQPVGANAINLAAMVARPTDLVRGRGTAGTPAVVAALPVAALFAGKPTPLPSSSTQSGTTGSAGAAPAPTGASN